MKLPGAFVKDDIINVVVETSAGHRNKYVWDSDSAFFRLKKILSEGIFFPANFGFVPGTRAADNDPLDVLLFSSEPINMGVVVACTILGISKVEQTENNITVRNDRILAVPEAEHTLPLNITGSKLLEEVDSFFAYYHQQEGVYQKVTGVGDKQEALQIIRDCMV